MSRLDPNASLMNNRIAALRTQLEALMNEVAADTAVKVDALHATIEQLHAKNYELVRKCGEAHATIEGQAQTIGECLEGIRAICTERDDFKWRCDNQKTSIEALHDQNERLEKQLAQSPNAKLDALSAQLAALGTQFKPNGLELWINEYDNQYSRPYFSAEAAKFSASPNAKRVAVHMKEAL